MRPVVLAYVALAAALIWFAPPEMRDYANERIGFEVRSVQRTALRAADAALGYVPAGVRDALGLGKSK
jgi:hypothetical protein